MPYKDSPGGAVADRGPIRGAVTITKGTMDILSCVINRSAGCLYERAKVKMKVRDGRQRVCVGVVGEVAERERQRERHRERQTDTERESDR